MDTNTIESKWKQIEKKIQESASVYGEKGFKTTSTPLHKNVEVKNNDPGVKDAPKEYDASKKMDLKTDNENKQGAQEATKEFEGSDKSAGKEDGVDREDGSAGGHEIAKKGYAATSFREKIRSKFGLSLDDKLNKPNMGKKGLS